ncbi:hypothetical protein CPB86DRAFT_467530 [Serendipita vermifera]|nr:hypothetical protein CPB86DRAFT_467530 [Serendipita vermifera]
MTTDWCFPHHVVSPTALSFVLPLLYLPLIYRLQEYEGDKVHVCVLWMCCDFGVFLSIFSSRLVLKNLFCRNPSLVSIAMS